VSERFDAVVPGARPLKRNVQHYVLNPLAKMMLSGEVKDGERVSVDVAHENGEETVVVARG
jgi:ATP-dependent Clp protease ATP-binding subunit ClpB